MNACECLVFLTLRNAVTLDFTDNREDILFDQLDLWELSNSKQV